MILNPSLLLHDIACDIENLAHGAITTWICYRIYVEEGNKLMTVNLSAGIIHLLGALEPDYSVPV